jgi:hypothetical protein
VEITRTAAGVVEYHRLVIDRDTHLILGAVHSGRSAGKDAGRLFKKATW